MLKDYLFLINEEPNFVETYDLESAFRDSCRKWF